jgi:hypothetical protein
MIVSSSFQAIAVLAIMDIRSCVMTPAASACSSPAIPAPIETPVIIDVHRYDSLLAKQCRSIFINPAIPELSCRFVHTTPSFH